MSPTFLLRDAQITSVLNNISTTVTTVTDYSSFINSSATFTKNGSHSLIAPIAKGVEFDETISISNEIIEQHDTFI